MPGPTPTVQALRRRLRAAAASFAVGAAVAAGALAAAFAAAPASAQALRIASAFDPQTMDPHALALLYHSRVAFQVHESLVGR
ncbi:MAG: hypothetical protein JNL85_18170, partial [Rubrivivax sp.]|nr:hypothetical protein [Rubrivivax sp.]